MAAREGEGILLHLRPHADHNHVATLFTLEYGRVGGLLKASRKRLSGLSPGARVHFSHARRVEKQLGTLQLDVISNPAQLVFHSPVRLQTIQYVCDLLALALADETPQPKLFDRTALLLEHIQEPDLWHNLAFWELDVLHATGFGLSLTPENAVPDPTGSPLYYVSPRTGKAVSFAMGQPYKDRLLLLPTLFGGKEGGFLDVFKLTGHFIQHMLSHLADKRPLASRHRLLDLGEASGFKE